jgi:hypothetical protein
MRSSFELRRASRRRDGVVARGEALLLATVVAFCGCTVRHFGRLSGPAPGDHGSVTLDVNAHRSGDATAVLADGERCRGRFNTVPNVTDREMSDGTGTTDIEWTQVGMLVLVCPAGRVIRCDFERDVYGPGAGSCRDGDARRYELELL